MAATAPSYSDVHRDNPPNYLQELSQIRDNHDTGYVFVDQAICFEEANRKEEALDMYYKSLKYLDDGLSVRLELIPCTESERTEFAKIQRKMTRIRNDVYERIYALSGTNNPPDIAPPYQSGSSRLYPDLDTECPPTYTEATQKTTDLQVSSSEKNTHSARLLLHIPSGVQIFHVNNRNEVSVQNDPTELHIYTLNRAYQPVGPQTVSWISTGEFTYPLVPKKSPVLKTGYGAYVFPDVHVNDDSGQNVALVLSAEISDELRARLDDILEDYADFRKERCVVVNPEDVPLGQKISDGIVSVSETLSRAMVRGAEATSVALNYGAEKLRERMTPEQRAVVVDPRIQTGLKVARATTNVTCRVTGYVVNAVGDMTMALGRKIARSIGTQDHVDGIQKNAALNDALLIAGGSLTGFGTLFMGLENAGKTLAHSITTNTVTLVDHKYGKNAGEVVGDALYSVGNFALTANNVKNLGVRGIAKRTAKDTGKAVLEQYTHQTPVYTVQEPEGPEAAGCSKKP